MEIITTLDDDLPDDSSTLEEKVKVATAAREKLEKTIPTQKSLDDDNARLFEEAIESSCNIDFETGELESDADAYGEDFDEDIYGGDSVDPEEEEESFEEMEESVFETCYDLVQDIKDLKAALEEADDADKPAIQKDLDAKLGEAGMESC